MSSWISPDGKFPTEKGKTRTPTVFQQLPCNAKTPHEYTLQQFGLMVNSITIHVHDIAADKLQPPTSHDNEDYVSPLPGFTAGYQTSADVQCVSNEDAIPNDVTSATERTGVVVDTFVKTG